jgi:hypothetical protein
MEELRDGDQVMILPINKTGVVRGDETSMHNYWVDYDHEYGGKFWYKDDLQKTEEDEQF